MPTSLPIKTIVAALDIKDDLGPSVLKTASALSERLGAGLHVIDIWPRLDAVGFPYSKMGEAAELEQYESARTARKTELEARVKSVAPSAIIMSPTGATADTIVDYLKAENADLLVIGSHQKSFWQRMLAGSVSEEAIHEAPCAVFVVTPGFSSRY